MMLVSVQGPAYKLIASKAVIGLGEVEWNTI